MDIGHIKWKARDDAGNIHLYASIFADAMDESTGTEDGRMLFYAAQAGTDSVEYMRFGGSEFTINETSKDIDFRVESDSNTHMLFVDSGENGVAIGTSANDTNAVLTAEGAISLDEISAPTATADRGKIYAMNTNNLFFQDGAGNNQPVMLGGRHSIWIPAEAISPRSNAGCAELAVTAAATPGRPDIRALGFDTSTDEHAQFTVAFPRTWNKGTVTAQFFWTAASGSGTVAWAIQGVALADNDAIDTAYGTAVLPATDTLLAAKDVHVTAETGAITIAGSPGHDELTSFQIYRDVSADNLGVDALLMGVKIFYTIAQGNENTAKDV